MLHSRETSAYTIAYGRPGIYFYVYVLYVYNWNIICNTNIHHVHKYCYDILLNNIYTKKSISLKTTCLDAAYGRPVCN